MKPFRQNAEDEGLLLQQNFTEAQIQQLKTQIERQEHVELKLCRLNEAELQIALLCPNSKQYHCQFLYLFRKGDGVQAQREYLLLTKSDSHAVECHPQKLPSNLLSCKELTLSSFTPYTGDQSIRTPRKSEHNDAEREEAVLTRTPKSIKCDKLYTEDEITLLKKELEFQSRGAISKSTQYHPELGHIVKLSFRCKFTTNCPYLSTLRYTYERNSFGKKLYKLIRINNSHLQSCLLSDEDIHYNHVTRKIDENMEVLTSIIQSSPNDIKPKMILGQFSRQIGEENADFIYEGLGTKMKKRAAKKYFDNSVAKARSLLK